MKASVSSNPAPGSLARFQDALARALIAPGAEPDADIAALVAQPAFAVYRNTVVKGCIDALQANYPAVTRIVGDEWLRAAAAAYVRKTLPTNPTLLHYGAGFADFLAGFEPASELAYLPDVARLDRYWTESHAAADENVLDPAAVSRLTPDALANGVLLPHLASRWGWYADAPIYTIWSHNRLGDACDEDLDWKPEGVLLTRPHDTVRWIKLDAAACVFLDACAAGRTVAMAANAALNVQGDADLARLMSTLLAAGAFSRMTSDIPEDH